MSNNKVVNYEFCYLTAGKLKSCFAYDRNERFYLSINGFFNEKEACLIAAHEGLSPLFHKKETLFPIQFIADQLVPGSEQKKAEFLELTNSKAALEFYAELKEEGFFINNKSNRD